MARVMRDNINKVYVLIKKETLEREVGESYTGATKE